MAFLDEISALLEGSSELLYPKATGNYWTAFDSTDPGLYFQDSTTTSGLVTLTTSTWPTGLTANARGDYVEDFGGVGGGITKWPIWKSHMPDSTVIGDYAIALIETAGEPAFTRDETERHGLQVIVRGARMSTLSTAYEETEAKAEDVQEQLIDYVGDTKTLATHYVGIWNVSGPFFGGFDASWRPSFSINYRVWRSRST